MQHEFIHFVKVTEFHNRNDPYKSERKGEDTVLLVE